MVELWTMGLGFPQLAEGQAQAAEAAGWDGIMYPDSQCMLGELYVSLALAARATTKVRIGTAVTNPFTRHASVTAASIATVHAETGGRTVLGIGRGDSALAHLGLAPATVTQFESYLVDLQKYLSGQEVNNTAQSVESLDLLDRPVSSRLQWLPSNLSKVGVNVYASGPKVFAVGARRAELVTLAVGADLERLRWAADMVRNAANGRDVKIGAMLNCVSHPNRDVARDLISNGVATTGRFTVMHGRTSGPMTDEQRRIFHKLHASYDMNHHGELDSAQTAILSKDFIDNFGIASPAEECAQRLIEIASLGMEHLLILGPTFSESRQADTAIARKTFESEVLPALKESAA
jgi:5,10-methylenetetrahydromethanopterin reductase